MKSFFTETNVKWLLQQGVGWTFLAVVLYWIAAHVISPMQDTHSRLVERVIETQGEIVKVQDKQTPILERIDHNTSK